MSVKDICKNTNEFTQQRYKMIFLIRFVFYIILVLIALSLVFENNMFKNNRIVIEDHLKSIINQLYIISCVSLILNRVLAITLLKSYRSKEKFSVTSLYKNLHLYFPILLTTSLSITMSKWIISQFVTFLPIMIIVNILINYLTINAFYLISEDNCTHCLLNIYNSIKLSKTTLSKMLIINTYYLRKSLYCGCILLLGVIMIIMDISIGRYIVVLSLIFSFLYYVFTYPYVIISNLVIYNDLPTINYFKCLW